MVNKYNQHLQKNVKSYIKTLLNKNLLIIILIFHISNFSIASEILDVSIRHSNEHTKIILESNEVLNFDSFFLYNPKRLVLDVKNITNLLNFNNLLKFYEYNDFYIKNIRLAKKSSNTIRIVFDLKQSIDHKIFSLEPIHS
ncbi:AMIN domain-containing protein [Candidatus Kinetoplastidibacterium stringomonadis]|uniref:AMIN domain-containing protein n=1 Tax=Candidatus Kinetoplastidibacterium stringomonadis TaxID=994696 RepID=UPI000686D870